VPRGPHAPDPADLQPPRSRGSGFGRLGLVCLLRRRRRVLPRRRLHARLRGGGRVEARARHLGDDHLWEAHVSALDNVVRAAAWRPREFIRVNDIDFGRTLRRFEPILFARLYDRFNDIAQLWDQILARLPTPGLFFKCLTIAHFKLWPDPPDTILTPKGIEVNLLSPGNHDVARVIEEARQLMVHKRSEKEAACMRICPWLPGWHGYVVPEDPE
jgi:hypothetical protein